MLTKLTTKKPKVFHLFCTRTFNAILDFRHSLDLAEVGFLNPNDFTNEK